MDSRTLRECHDCGLVQRWPRLPRAAAFACSRCKARIGRQDPHQHALTLACSTIALILYVLALSAPFASVSMQGGRFSQGDLLTGAELFYAGGEQILAFIVAVTLVGIPLLQLLGIASIALGGVAGWFPRWMRHLVRQLPTTREWAMVDVFLLGAMIALVRLDQWMAVDLGPAAIALCGVLVCFLTIDRTIDWGRLWQRVHPIDSLNDSAEAGPVDAPTIGCPGCFLVTRANDGDRCIRCGREMHVRKSHSMQRSTALVLAAALLAIPANVLPVMTVSKLGGGEPSTILGGTVELAERGFWGLAIIVFVASVVVPFVKIGALSALLLTTRSSSSGHLLLRTRVHRALSIIGRWSMLDVFAAATLVMLARFAWVGSVAPEPGLAAFAGVVILTMLATETFDPRLMWDAAGRNAASRSAEGAHA